jgi:tetratricopeptide (TPR) repeat protein
MSNPLRVAVCQIETHPAIVVGDRDYRSEPFVPGKSSVSLSDLRRHGVDVTQIQRMCREEYDEWSARRLKVILDCLGHLNPVPDLVVLPECAVPIHDLYSIRSFASLNDCVVFAGTHTFRQTSEDSDFYKALDLSRKELRAIPSYVGKTVLPIFSGAHSLLHTKEAPSVFEQTDLLRIGTNPLTIDPIALKFRNRELHVLASVCAEALQLSAPSRSYDMSVIIAYNETVDPFLPFIKHNIQNKKPTVFCNDGKFGFSSVNVVNDARMNGIWWWGDAIRGFLPPGDAILIVDLNLESSSPQMGVANPEAPAKLVAILPLLSANGTGVAASKEISAIETKSDNSIQASLLDGCVSRLQLTGIQKLNCLQLKRLAESGTATSDWWQALGKVVISENEKDLKDLESSLAQRCLEFADDLLINNLSINDVQLGNLTRYKRECHSRLTRSPEGKTRSPSVDLTLDRNEETQQVREFLDHSMQRVLFVSGLEDIGKISVVELSIRQSGRNFTRIDLNPDASLRFLSESLARNFGALETGVTNLDAVEDPRSLELIDRIPLGQVVIFTSTENLKERTQWRDPSSPSWLASFAEALQRRKAKLILVSSMRIDLESHIEPSLTRRIYIRGLPEEFAQLLMERQIRRVGLDPTNISVASKAEIVRCLGCHPGAIILAAEYIEREGLTTVLSDLRKRGTVHAQIVRRILRRLKFSEDEQLVMALLSHCRIPMPRTVLTKCRTLNGLEACRNLIHIGVIERHANDHVALTDLVRGFADFAELPKSSLILFHKSAAEEFASLGRLMRSPEELTWAIESNYHANLAGDVNLARSVPTLVDGTVGAVQTLVDSHDYEIARPIVDRLLQSNRTAELYQLGAIVYARLGRCDEALTLVKEAVSLDRNRMWAVSEVGNLALHVHRSDIAKECVELARRTGHDSTYLATLEGKIQLKKDGELAAVEAFRRAVALSESEPQPYDAWPHFYLGRTLLRLNQAEQAIDVLFRGDEILTNRRLPNRKLLIAIRTQLAIGYLYCSNIKEAGRIFDLITEEDRGRAEVIWAFALYKAASGQSDSIDFAKETLRDLDPSAAKDRYARCQVYLYRALIYIGIGNRSRASEEFSKAHEQDPRNVFVILRWTQTLVDLAKQSDLDGEHQAARICAEHAKALADKVLEFDRDNQDAIRILELLSDDFNIS